MVGSSTIYYHWLHQGKSTNIVGLLSVLMVHIWRENTKALCSWLFERMGIIVYFLWLGALVMRRMTSLGCIFSRCLSKCMVIVISWLLFRIGIPVFKRLFANCIPRLSTASTCNIFSTTSRTSLDVFMLTIFTTCVPKRIVYATLTGSYMRWQWWNHVSGLNCKNSVFIGGLGLIQKAVDTL